MDDFEIISVRTAIAGLVMDTDSPNDGVVRVDLRYKGRKYYDWVTIPADKIESPEAIAGAVELIKEINDWIRYIRDKVPAIYDWEHLAIYDWERFGPVYVFYTRIEGGYRVTVAIKTHGNYDHPEAAVNYINEYIAKAKNRIAQVGYMGWLVEED